MMSQLEKKTYEAPTLTVVTIKAERGYGASTFGQIGFTPVEPELPFENHLESRNSVSNYWGYGDDDDNNEGWF